MEQKSSDFFILLIPTGSGNGDINTMFRLSILHDLLGKWFFPSTATNRGIPAARTNVVEKLKKTLDERGIKHNGTIRGMFFDDDIIIDPEYDMGKLADAIKKADENGWNLVANYHVEYTKEIPTTPVMMHTQEGTDLFKFYTQAEVDALKDFDELHNTTSGLGFYYGDIPLDYKFWYADQKAEDGNFFKENKIKLRYINVPLFHKKMQYI
jgi:hypothetical protein